MTTSTSTRTVNQRQGIHVNPPKPSSTHPIHLLNSLLCNHIISKLSQKKSAHHISQQPKEEVHAKEPYPYDYRKSDLVNKCGYLHPMIC